MYKKIGRRVAANPALMRPTRDYVEDPVKRMASRGVIVVVQNTKHGLIGEEKIFWSMSRALVLEAAEQILQKQQLSFIVVFYYDILGGKEKLLERGDERHYKSWSKKIKALKRKRRRCGRRDSRKSNLGGQCI